MNMGHGEEVSEQLSPATMDCLPDDLLVQILTFLPMKQAVSTSVLSKRWRTLFAFTHILGFDELFFSYYQQNQWKRREIQKKFRDFAYRTLALQRGSHINKLFLDLDTYINGGVVVVVKHWICYALKHGVSMLYLRITPGCLPSKVFTSTTLVKLSLGRRFIIDSFPLDTSLPALKVLFLDTIWFKGDQFSNVFLAACPALEDLTIQYYKYYPEYAVPISSKTIKKLSVTRDCDYYDSFSRIISFDTPNVVDFYYSDYCEHESPQCHLDSVGKATLDLYHEHTNDQDATDVTNLIRGIRNVKTLRLTSSTVEVISVCCKGGLPVFTNLIDLVFSSDKRRGWRVFLPLLLEHSPNLKTLVLSGLHRYTIKRRHRFVGIQIPLNNQIKMLRIMQYQGSAHELKHISHFLLKMECLEVLKVYISPTMDDTKQMQLTKDILKLPKASSNLKIQVMYSLLSSMGFQLKTNWQ